MATTVVPLNPSPFDPVATAELERVVLGLTEQEYLDFRADVREAIARCPEHLRHLLVVVEERDDTHLVDLVWQGDELVPAQPRRRLRVEQLESLDDLPHRRTL